MLNPLIALLALIGLTHSVRAQREALDEAKKASEAQIRSHAKQLSKQTFFDLLNLRASAVSSVNWYVNDNYVHGRSAIKEITSFFIREVEKNGYRYVPSPMYDLSHLEIAQHPVEKVQSIITFFAVWYCGEDNIQIQNKDHKSVRHPLYFIESELGHVFRATYQILKFIYHSNDFSLEEKKDLVNYLRAQMSESEFLLYSLSGCNSAGYKSRALAIHFHLLEGRLKNFGPAADVAYLYDPNDMRKIVFKESALEKIPLEQIIKPNSLKPVAKAVIFTSGRMLVNLEDGRTVSLPLAWFPRLSNASSDQLIRYKINSNAINWDDLEESVSVNFLLAGRTEENLQRL